MNRGPIDYICSECGAKNELTAYAEAIKCYACGKSIKFSEDTKAYFRERFPEGASHKPKENIYEKQIFQSLNLLEEDAKYISISEDTVYFSFPVKMDINLWVGGRMLQFDDKTLIALYEAMQDFIEWSLLKEGGVNNINLMTISTDSRPEPVKQLEFYKDINNDDEAKEAVKWLIEFKKRIGI